MDVYGSQCGLRWQMEIKLLDPCVAKEKKRERKTEKKKERK